MRPGLKTVLVAVAAGALGVVASVAMNGPGPLLGTDLGQRIVQEGMRAAGPAAPAGLQVAQRGHRAPTFALTARDGRTVTIPDAFAGRPVLINLWASWCGPCVREMPELQRFHARQGAQGTQVVGIALDDPQAVRDFLARLRIDYPILLDAAGPADAGVRLGNPKGVLPYSVLLSADGTVLKERIGPFADGEIRGWVEN